MRPRRRLVVGSALLALVVAACGNDGTDAASTTVSGDGPPSSVFLADLSPSEEGGCSGGDDAVAGEEFPSSLLCGVSANFGDTSSAVYLVNGLATGFEATIGQSDDSNFGWVVRVVVRADDEVVVDETVGYGEARPVSVEVTGASRLSVEVTLEMKQTDGGPPTVVLGSARLVGDPDAIEELAGG